MIKKIITQQKSYVLGVIEPDCLIETSACGAALIFELFDNKKQEVVKVITPLMPRYSFTVPYKSEWILIVKFNGNSLTPTEFKLEVLV